MILAREQSENLNQRQCLTISKSAEMNARIGQLCQTVASGHELTELLNQQFGLGWNEHAYWKRARKEGHPWPGPKVRRAAQAESTKLNERLRELCADGVPGTEIREILNRELGLNPPWTLNAFWGRANKLGIPWTRTQRAGRRQMRTSAEYLPEDRRQACYEDPAYEGRNGILDRVICRECLLNSTRPVELLRDGAMDGKRGHLWTIHKITLESYFRRNPGVRIFTFERIALQQDIDLDEYVAKEVAHYATPEERAAALKSARYEDDNGITAYIICRVERCGFKSIARLDKHLDNAHEISTKEYRRERAWPIMTRDELKAKAKLTKKRWQLAWRPADWNEKGRELWRAIGTILLSTTGYMSNTDLGERLDAAYIKCPYGPPGTLWEAALSSDKGKKQKGAINLITDIRKWVKRPGKNPAAKKSLSLS